jgi:short-subunit dehydrogenase
MKNARVYITARTQEKGDQTTSDIKHEFPQGELPLTPLELNDLENVATAAKHIVAHETKMHVLFNNAGIMLLCEVERTVQSYEGQLGV